MNIDRTFLDVKSTPGSIGGVCLSSKRSLDRLLAHLRLNACPTRYIGTRVNPSTYLIRCFYHPTVPDPSRERPLEMIAVGVLSPNYGWRADFPQKWGLFSPKT